MRAYGTHSENCARKVSMAHPARQQAWRKASRNEGKTNETWHAALALFARRKRHAHHRQAKNALAPFANTWHPG